ncbi:hypothetical protein AK88_04275 [Plasmodium fragile]|uniref:Uncharacterized protein n=1 Tax=Plasmodium fragile TaxID=5857 RepID=A0A0D9QGG3_PLAFR|nr:uncharacterized protein AK88_04275 [Plasmodium fragile]KJP86084.1 hypothetical protein AK88_04275 [Plasmodium fragile]
MVANEDNVVYGHSEFGAAATVQINKLDAWKEWFANQHALMSTYSEQAWFQPLLSTVEEETVPDKGDIHGVDQHFNMEQVMAAEHMLRVRDLPRSQTMHPQPYMKKVLTAKTWILFLALVIEHCEVERRLQERELYVDALLQTCSH